QLRIVIQVIERVRSLGSLEQREIQGFHQDPFAVVEGFELTKWVRQAGLARKMGAPFDSGSVYHRDKDPVGECGRDGQMVVRVQTVKRSLCLLGPGGWFDYEFRALVREGGEPIDMGLRLLPVLEHVSATRELRKDNDVSGHGLGPPSHTVPIRRRLAEGGRELNEP